MEVVRTKQESFISATEFWMGVECLSPNSAPKCKKEAPTGPLTWELSIDSQLPWLDPVKVRDVKGLIAAKARQTKKPESAFTVQYTAYCGLIPMPQVIEVIRTQFGLDDVADAEPRKLEPVATLAVILNDRGFVAGDLFVSSLPWAVNQVLIAKPEHRLNFTGFFEKEGMQERLLAELERAMEGLLLIKADEQEDESTTEDSRNGELRPLYLAAVEALCKDIYAASGWMPSISLTTIRVQAKVVSVKQKDKDEADLLNSFFVDDLGRIGYEIRNNNYGKALETFLTAKLRGDRSDIRAKGDSTVDEAVMPCLTPLGAWPSKHGLVRAQQFAVNKIMQRLGNSPGIFSVNGPPGTGKTTLLRDIVAAVVVKRAEAMSAFSDPLNAFAEKVTVEGWKYGELRALDPSLCDSGIVVASSNNGAVENITKELPGIEALPKGFPLRYLSAVSDSIATPSDAKKRSHGSTWGLIAAAMGNKSNLRSFFQKFRWPSDIKTEEGGLPLQCLWELIESKEYVPIPWDVAVSEFKDAHKRADDARAKLQSIAVAVKNKQACGEAIARVEVQLIQRQTDLSLAADKFNQAKVGADRSAIDHESAQMKADALKAWYRASARVSEKNNELESGGYERLDEDLDGVEDAVRRAGDNRAVAERLLSAVQNRRPGFFATLFSFGRRVEVWEQEVRDAEGALRGATRDLRDSERTLGEKKSKIKSRDRLKSEMKMANADLATALHRCRDLGISQPSKVQIDAEELAVLKERALTARGLLEKTSQLKADAEARFRKNAEELARYRNALDEIEISLQANDITPETEEKWLGVGLSDDELQLASPWFDNEFFQARQALFCRAIELHESFIAHSWKILKNNLGVVAALGKGEVSVRSVKGDVNRLWDSLFLVVPVVSTTFASFARMFEGWGRESIGWLLIDEAGQATPQAAAGAIWRSRRVVVVGDPRQLEPVVTLPPRILEPLMDRCRADHVYDPSASSVQVLADMGNEFGTHLGQGDDAQWVGSPLRVHRRCLDPMFSVANRISYDNMMVYGAGEDKEDLWFGKSCWIEVPATSRNGNSVPEQVAVAANMAAQFEQHYGLKTNGKFNLYLITPFRDVRNALRDALGSRLKTRSSLDKLFGTVHTFQGKEADVVILVLGGTPGSIASFAALKANLLNVALTRAKKRIYVIGDPNDWKNAPYFSTLYRNSKLEKRDALPEIIQSNVKRALPAHERSFVRE